MGCGGSGKLALLNPHPIGHPNSESSVTTTPHKMTSRRAISSSDPCGSMTSHRKVNDAMILCACVGGGGVGWCGSDGLSEVELSTCAGRAQPEGARAPWDFTEGHEWRHLGVVRRRLLVDDVDSFDCCGRLLVDDVVLAAGRLLDNMLLDLCTGRESTSCCLC